MPALTEGRAVTMGKRPMKPADHAVFKSTAEWVRDASARNRLRAVPFAQRQAEADAAYRRALEAGGRQNTGGRHGGEPQE